MLKLTVASYYRPSGENIHRFKNAKTTDKWGVSPDPGAEVKLPIREFINWFRARRDRDQEASAKGHRKQPAAAADADTGQGEDGKASRANLKQKGDGEKRQNIPKPAGPYDKQPTRTRIKRASSPKSTGRPPARFIDEQLDKAAGNLCRRKLAETKGA